MSTKTRKSAAAAATSVEVSSTERPTRPTSPNESMLITRIEEKEHLAGLNDRFASYIDRVRQLQLEKQQLNTRIETHEETIIQLRQSLTTKFESEISQCRKALDKAETDKAQLVIDNKRVLAKNKELQNALAVTEKENASLEKKLSGLDKTVRDLQAKVDNLDNLRAKAEETKANALRELNEKKQELKTAQNQLEQETLLRIKRENELTSTKESLEFQKTIREQEFNQTRQSIIVETEEQAQQMQMQYNQQLTDELRSIREEYDEQRETLQRELEDKYELQLADLRTQLSQRSSQESKSRGELQSYRSRCESLSSKLKEAEANIESLKSRVVDLEKVLEQERNWHAQAIGEKNSELSELNDKLNQQLKDYQELLSVKIALDMEINTYRKLLEGEETRLNLSSTSMASNTPSRRTPSRVSSPRVPRSASKRRNVVEEVFETTIDNDSHAEGDLEVVDHDIDGKYVTILNKGQEDIALAGWTLIRQADSATHTYKFGRNLTIQAGQKINIWSSNAGATHSPPDTIVMKSQNWPVADHITTRLMDNEGTEMARRISTKSLHTSKRRQLTTDGDDQRCLIM